MRKISLAAIALVCLGGPALAADATGDWLVAKKTAVIRIEPCAAAQRADPALCGRIAWTKGPPGTDTNNPDPAKRNRSILGLPTLLDMKPTAANRWEGNIYNAEDGKTYSGRIMLTSENVLRIEGCVLGFLCGGENWTRAKCEEAHAAPGAPPAGKGKGATTPPAPASPSAPAPLPSLTACHEVAP